MEIATKTELPDVVRWLKFSGAAWLKDGFFYSGYDKPAPGRELTAKNEFQKVFFHKLGDPQEKDALVYEDKEHPLRYLNLGVSEDQAYAFLTVSEGTSGNELLWKPLAEKDAEFKLLIKGFDTDSAVVDNVGDKFLVHTNHGAPNYRVVRIDPEDPAPEKWVDVIPERPEVLLSAGTAGGQLFCAHLKDVLTRFSQHGLDGTLVREIELPGSRHGRRLRRLEGRQDRLLHLHLLHASADDLQVRHRLREPPRCSGRRRSSSIPPTTRPSRSSTRARTGPRSRCSSSTGRGSSSTGRTRPS